MNDPHLLLAIAIADRSGRAHLRLLALPRYARLVAQNCGVERMLKERFTRVVRLEVGQWNERIEHQLPCGWLHRTERDSQTGHVLPAEIDADGGYRAWFKNDQTHRDDVDAQGKTLPAVMADGSHFWFKNDQKHRDDVDEYGNPLPAVVYENGRQEWWDRGMQFEFIPRPRPRPRPVSQLGGSS